MVFWDNMFFLKYDYKSVIYISLSLLVVFGCAATTDRRIAMLYPQHREFSSWPDKKLEKRFQEYWFNRFSGRVEDAYKMETAYLREVIQLGKYNNYVKHTSNNKLLDVEIEKISKESDYLFNVYCNIRTQAIGGKSISTSIIDRWVYTDNIWYHFIKDPILLSF
jgi:hypothetical protein